MRTTGIDSWPLIAHALNMTVDQARDEFTRWATDHIHHHRISGRGLSAAEAQQWIALLPEASR